MNPQPDIRQIEVVDPRIAEILRQKTPAEHIVMIGEANRTARHLLAAGIRYHHQEWSDDSVQAEVARRMLRGTT